MHFGVGSLDGQPTPRVVPQRRDRRGVGLRGPYLTLMDEGAPQRLYPLREVFNGLHYIVRTGLR